MLPITIGIPAYNEAQYIERTIALALGQRVQEIVICDNASTDGTWEIIQAMASAHPQIVAFRHEQNQGPVANFMHCINIATQSYFMFLGAHDLLSEQHTAHLFATLHEHKAIGAYANAAYVDHSLTLLRSYSYTYARSLLSPSPLFRVLELIRNISDGTIVHGLYQHKAYRDVWHREDFVMSDVFYVGHMALQGKLALCPDIIYYRTENRAPEHIEEKVRRHQAITRFFSPYQTKLRPRERFALAVSSLFRELALRYPDAAEHLEGAELGHK